MTGAEQSWFLGLLILRSADQFGAGFRRVLWYGHVSAAGYFALLLYLDVVENRPVVWPVEGLKVASIYALNWYLSLCSRATERIRNRFREAREMIDDLNERRLKLSSEKQKAEEANLAKSEFLAAVSHEIRTPLNGIMATSGLLLDTELTDDQREYAQLGRQCSVELLELVNGLLDLSKIEARAIGISPSEFELPGLVEDVLELARTVAINKQIQLSSELGVEVPGRVKTDRSHLRRVLLNLVLNAIKFTSAGRVEIRVGAPICDAGVIELHFEVMDTGIGIPANAATRIFEPYYRATGSGIEIRDGTGLGLTISKRLVEAMGGRIGFRSEPGAGTTFWFDLPVQRAQMPSSQATGMKDDREAALDTADKLILVVEDDPVSRKVLVRILEMLGYQVHAVSDGTEGVLAATRTQYALIFMDCRMPGIDGLEATRRIRRAEGSLRHTPIVALTGDAMPEDVSECLNSGMDEYLSKPVDKQTLIKVIRRNISPQPRASSPAEG